MGMGTGSGAGTGAGSGFSSRRSGMNNVGLYGGLPSQASGQGGDGFGPARDQAGGPGRYSGTDTIGEAAVFESSPTGGTMGGTQGSIPPQYRRRVGAYFQRIAEEASR
jgi:hypothetical protein